MGIKRYEELGENGLDIIKEVANIGTGYAATSLASMLEQEVRMSIPKIKILGYDETITELGDPEECVAAVLTSISGDIDGIMLFLLRLDFINIVLDKMLNRTLTDYSELSEMELSVVTEIGNIIMSSYTNAIAMMTQMKIKLCAPSLAVNMLGGIMSVPMTEFGYETDKLMLIDGDLIVNSQKLNSTLLLMPDIDSLNTLMKRLGGVDE